jgi:hypothetical protein
MKLIGKDSSNYTFYEMSVKDDRFVHFTTKERAKEILETGKLLMDPPYKKFGIDVVNAVSTTYGSYVPTVAVTHLKGQIVSLIFKTNTEPDYGVAEEVIWKTDVNLIEPKIESKEKGISLIKNTPEKIDDQEEVIYKKSEIKKIENYLKKKVTSAIRVAHLYLIAERSVNLLITEK